MKTYKGKLEIECTQKKGCLRNLHQDVQAGCMDCPRAVTRVVDLDGKVLFEYRSPVERTGERKQPGKGRKTSKA